MKHLLPTNLNLLVELAARANVDYYDAYAIWAQVYEREDAYPIVETVLYIARMHRLPVQLALMAYQRQPSWATEHVLTDCFTAS